MGLDAHSKEVKFEDHIIYSSDLKKACQKCLNIDPKKRPAASEILKSKLIQVYLAEQNRNRISNGIASPLGQNSITHSNQLNNSNPFSANQIKQNRF